VPDTLGGDDADDGDAAAPRDDPAPAGKPFFLARRRD
jgi:hypothetical protein